MVADRLAASPILRNVCFILVGPPCRPWPGSGRSPVAVPTRLGAPFSQERPCLWVRRIGRPKVGGQPCFFGWLSRRRSGSVMPAQRRQSCGAGDARLVEPALKSPSLAERDGRHSLPQGPAAPASLLRRRTMVRRGRPLRSDSGLALEGLRSLPGEAERAERTGENELAVRSPRLYADF